MGTCRLKRHLASTDKKRVCLYSRRCPHTHPIRCGHRPREVVDRQVSVGRGTPPVVTRGIIRADTALTCQKTIAGNKPACSTTSWLTLPAR